MTWFYEMNGAHQGPVTVEDLLRLLAENQIRPDSLVWREGLAGWMSLESAGVLADAPGEPMAVCAYSGVVRPQSAMIPYGHLWVLPEHREVFVQTLMAGGRVDAGQEGLEPGDYTVPIGECLSRGWQSLVADFWPNVGASAIVLVIYFAVSSVPYLGSLAGFFQAPLFAGLFWYFLEKTRGRRVEVGAVFAGFSRHFLQLFLLGLIMGLLALAVMVPGIAALIAGAAMMDAPAGDTAGVVLAIAGVVLLFVPLVYLQVAWMFSTILCIDQRLNFWPSMLISQRTVNKHWFACFLFTLVAGLISLAGMAALCVGLFVAMPWVTLSMVHLYEHVFGRSGAAKLRAS